MYVCYVYLCVIDCINRVIGNYVCIGNIIVICVVKYFNIIIILII